MGLLAGRAAARHRRRHVRHNEWNTHRGYLDQVLDAHSLYLEAMGELGLVGLALVLAVVLTVLAGLAWRLGGEGRPAYAALLAVTLPGRGTPEWTGTGS